MLKMTTSRAIKAVVIFVFGAIATLIVQSMLTKPELTVSLLSFEKVIEKKDDSKDIIITYKGENVENLYKSKFLLKNSGGKPITKQQIERRIEIHLSSNIIDTYIEKKSPEDVAFSLSKKEVGNAIILDFSLLNPNDELVFGLLTTSKFDSFNVQSRIEGIRSISVHTDVKKRELMDKMGIFKYISIPLLMVFIYLLYLLQRDWRRKDFQDIRKLCLDKLNSEDILSKDDLFYILNTGLSITRNNERNYDLEKYIRNLSQDKFETSECRAKIINAIRESFEDERRSIKCMMVVCFILNLCFAYIAYFILLDMFAWIKEMLISLT